MHTLSLLQVPSAAEAKELLSGLRGCGIASHRDTPCVPTYFFRICEADSEVYGPPPRVAGDLPQVKEAKKKLQMGVPPPAVKIDLSRKGVDPSVLDLDLNAELPEKLRQPSVAVEWYVLINYICLLVPDQLENDVMLP